MVKRIITGAVLIAVLLVVVLLCPSFVAAILLALISAWSYLELTSATKTVRSLPLRLTGLLMSIWVPIRIGFGWGGSFLSLTVFVILLFGCWILEYGKRRVDFKAVLVTFFGGYLIPTFYSCLLTLLGMYEGKLLIFMPFLAAYVCDAVAYFVGSKFGKTKMSPRISPHKTWEGAISGIVGTVMAFLLYGLILLVATPDSISFGALFAYGLIGSCAGILGDLAMSMIKREAGIKDFGNVFPGHGGMLDRFDSLLFTAPVILAMFELFPALF